MTAVAQRSFSGGEITPSLYARVDVSKYHTSLRTCRNMIVARHGGTFNRPGTKFVAEVKDSSKTVKLIRFKFNNDQTYALEFGNLYMRVIKNGALVEVSSVSAWDSGPTYVIGDLVVEGGVNYYCILGHTNQQPPNATYWHALTGSIFEIPTPYLEADLPTLNYDQSADVITLTHPTYDVRELARTGDTAWTLSVVTFAPATTTPANVAVSGTGGGLTFVYHITALDPETFEESLAGTKSQGSLTAPDSNDHTITWDAVSGVTEYNVYLEKNGIAGFLAVVGTNSYVNSSNTPDTTDTPPTARNPFSGSDNFPATSGYYQQRHNYAGSNNSPEDVDMSRTGKFKNFTRSSPIQDDDSVNFNMAGTEVNRVKHMIVLGKLIIMASGGEHLIKGNEADQVKPGEIYPEQISYHGSGDVRPLLIGSTALFIQERGSIIRDLVNDSIRGFTSDDLTVYSAHLFDGFTIVDWDYQEVPNSIVWVVRSDGVLLGFTYLRSQEMFAWHRHDTDGTFENVLSLPEGLEDSVYVVVKRTIDGSTVRYIERFNTRRISDIEDLILMDSSLSYDGTNTGATTMTLSGGTDWEYEETLTLTASAGFFVSGDVGKGIHLTGSDGEMIRFTIATFNSVTEVLGTAHKTVPSSLQDTATLVWGKAVKTFSGLEHLEGENIAAFGDGFVDASPNNAAYTTKTVSSGSVTLDKLRVVMHIGLPYICDIETLDIDTVKGETLSDKKKLIGEVHMYVEKTRGIWAGSEPPSDDSTDPLEGLFEFKARNAEGYDSPVSLKTDVIEIPLQTDWSQGGRVFIRQVDPVPMSILSIVPAGFIPFRR